MEKIRTIGRRKTSVARIGVISGKGEVTVNKRTLSTYFPSEVLQHCIKSPLQLVEEDGKYDIVINVTGGGPRGQAEATRLAIARALCQINPEHRGALKKAKFLVRDPRTVERKKYGQKKARKKFQFSKR